MNVEASWAGIEEGVFVDLEGAPANAPLSIATCSAMPAQNHDPLIRHGRRCVFNLRVHLDYRAVLWSPSPPASAVRRST